LPAVIEPAMARLVTPLLAISLPSSGVFPLKSLIIDGIAAMVF